MLTIATDVTADKFLDVTAFLLALDGTQLVD